MTSDAPQTGFRNLQLATDGETPRYVQIVHAVLMMVVRGEMRPQEVLPSAPALAGRLGVANGTVNKAYGELQEERVVVVREGRGTFLTPGCREIAQRMLESLAMRQLANVALQSHVLGWDDDEMQRRVTTMRQQTVPTTTTTPAAVTA